MRIITLEDIIKMSETDRLNIKMKTRHTYDGHTWTDETKGVHNFQWKQIDVLITKVDLAGNSWQERSSDYSLNWHSEEGDPDISIELNEDIDFICDSSDGEYEYQLYIE